MKQAIAEVILDFVRWAPAGGWLVDLKVVSASCLPQEIQRRYPQIPADYLAFTQQVDRAVSADDTACILCCRDFSRKKGLRWNEFERISLAAVEDDIQSEAVRRFWNMHLPVLLSVSGDYCFYAIRLADGVIVNGYAPVFEDTTVVAASFCELLEKLVAGRLRL